MLQFGLCDLDSPNEWEFHQYIPSRVALFHLDLYESSVITISSLFVLSSSLSSDSRVSIHVALL